MRKQRFFSVLLMYLSFTLMALGLVFVSCGPEPEPEPDTFFTVRFDANGGSGTPPSAQAVQPGFGITLPSAGNLTKMLVMGSVLA